MLKRNKEKIHFIGIGGIGMSGIAEILHELGFPISGSDIYDSETTRKLASKGVEIKIGHKAENLEDARVVVYSSAIKEDNSELKEARRKKIPLVARAEMLAELMRLKYGIAVAGTHGKTTTTSMLGTILSFACLDPTVVVGGKVNTFGGNAKLGLGRFLVAESDESDGSFLKLSPVLNVITNIDNDHLDYYSTMQNLESAFVEFANKVPYYGTNIVCFDNPRIRSILPKISKPFMTFGFEEGAEVQLKDFQNVELGSKFELWKENSKWCDVQVKVPGLHNALNATAALLCSLEVDVDLETAIKGLATFTGVQRRFEKIGTVNGITVIDDYGHHPTEIEAVLKTAKAIWKNGKVVVVFQPHRFTRTQSCWSQFGAALKLADEVFLLDIYPAGEVPIPGIDSKTLSKEFALGYFENFEVGHSKLKESLRSGDLLITLGAGSITKFGPRFISN